MVANATPSSDLTLSSIFCQESPSLTDVALMLYSTSNTEFAVTLLGQETETLQFSGFETTSTVTFDNGRLLGLEIEYLPEYSSPNNASHVIAVLETRFMP